MPKPLTQDELVTMRKAGVVASAILKKIGRFVKPGVTTKEIEFFFDRELAKHKGMAAAFKGFMGYPASCCISVNEEVIHGIPCENRVLENGDLVSVDIGIEYKGLFVDTACTYGVGKLAGKARQLRETTLCSLNKGIKAARAGATIGDIGFAVQDTVERKGFSVIRRFVGHGIGRSLHLPPEVPNFGQKHQGEKLLEGYAIAIEPMVCEGGFDVEILEDGWTARTKDGLLSAHFEHTVAVTKKGPWVLTQ
ncbi:MAG: type I methionyl aminopeptidase [Candidatus Omnitrophica bacterium]|nr:type I methionyl aminopeptidase [Candidatus Omnitrophota bacterium]MDD5429141.1 type I methionyl aminopeptidase [Candidatus Omnitrophota bacterium]